MTRPPQDLVADEGSVSSDVREAGRGDGAVGLVDHVWSNIRLFLTERRFSRACQLGGDRLTPQLTALAERVTVAHLDLRPEDVAGSRTSTDAASLPDGSFDLVVVEVASTDVGRLGEVVGEAERLVAANGYVVVTTSGRRARRALARVVRRDGASYVALPNARRPAILVDRVDPAAGRYFVRHVAFAYRAPGKRGAKARLLQLRNRVGMAAPPSVALAAAPGRVTVLRSDAADPPILDEICSFIRSSWASLGSPGKAPDRFSPLVISHRKTPSALVSVVLLGGDVPLVAKMPRYGGSNDALQREQRRLEDVLAEIAGPITRTIPRPLGVHRIGDTDVLLQTVVPGRHLVAETATRRLSRGMLERQFDLMFGWSRGLQQASGHWVVADDDLIDRTLVPLADAALDALGQDPAVERLLARAVEHARALRGTPLRLAVVHGDYWAGNVLVEDGRVTGVVDWERASPSDLPVWDPVKTVMDAAYHLDRYRAIPRRGRAALPSWGDLGPWEGIADPRCAVGFRAVVAEPGWLSDLARERLVRAFVDAEIPLGWLPVAIPFHVAREFVHADVSARSVEAWGSVLRALAEHPVDWVDDLIGDRRGARRDVSDAMSDGADGGRS